MIKKKIKIKKSKSLAKYKRELDAVFSKFIRNKHADKYGRVRCYTCGKRGEVKTMQCGHFVSRQYLATRWNEDNCRVQCLTQESKLRLFSGRENSIKNIKQGDKLWAFDEVSFEKKVSYVLGVRKFVPKVLYQVEMEDGSMFCATPTHKVVANGKWTKIKEMLHSVTTYNIMEI